MTAKATPGATEVSTKLAFAVGAAPSAVPAAINFVSAAPNDKSIVIKGSGGNGRTEVALLTFKVVDSANSAVANAKVLFTTQSTKDVTLTSTSATTDANGTVTVAVNSGTEPTTVRVLAAVSGVPISAISDTVTVTTGQPDQTRFSLAVEKFYIEGANVDNVTNKITVCWLMLSAVLLRMARRLFLQQMVVRLSGLAAHDALPLMERALSHGGVRIPALLAALLR